MHKSTVIVTSSSILFLIQNALDKKKNSSEIVKIRPNLIELCNVGIPAITDDHQNLNIGYGVIVRLFNLLKLLDDQPITIEFTESEFPITITRLTV